MANLIVVYACIEMTELFYALVYRFLQEHQITDVFLNLLEKDSDAGRIAFPSFCANEITKVMQIVIDLFAVFIGILSAQRSPQRGNLLILFLKKIFLDAQGTLKIIYGFRKSLMLSRKRVEHQPPIVAFAGDGLQLPVFFATAEIEAEDGGDKIDEKREHNGHLLSYEFPLLRILISSVYSIKFAASR